MEPYQAAGKSVHILSRARHIQQPKKWCIQAAHKRVHMVQEFADGSLGSSTALFHQPYLQQHPPTSGVRNIPTAQLEAMAVAADLAGLQVAVHAIGDLAVDEVMPTDLCTHHKGLRAVHGNVYACAGFLPAVGLGAVNNVCC